MDILDALKSAPSFTSSGRCKLQTILDSIPENAAGRDDLIAALATDSGWANNRLAIVFANLGKPVSATGIRNHRARCCACYGVRV